MPYKHNFDHLATKTRPQLTCVCCGAPLYSFWQPALVPTKEGMWMVECHNNPIDCLMPMQTFSSEHYPPANLDAYLAAGEKVRTARLAKLPEEWKTA